MNRRNAALALIIAAVFVMLMVSAALAQGTGVTAEALNPVNLRANTFVESDKVGEMTPNVAYPVLARNEFYPWLLLGDPATGEAIGWVFADIVTVTGNVNNLPFDERIIDPSAIPTATQAAPADNTADTNGNNGAAAAGGETAGGPVVTVNAPDLELTPSPQATNTPAFTVAGTISAEVNIRYGPSIDYPRVGVGRAGDRFQITGYHTQVPWVQIAYEASPTGRAWLLMDLLEIEGDIFTLTAITDSTLNLPPLSPTPSVVSNGVDLGGETLEASPEFMALGEQIWSLVLENEFDLATSRFASLFLMDLQTGEAVTFGSDIAYSGTSLNKVAILARLYASLSAPPDARLATDIANTMICSENVATNRLLNAIGNGDEFAGAAEVTRMMQELGLDDTFITYPYLTDPENPPVPSQPVPQPTTPADQDKADPDLSNQTSVEDIGWLLNSIYQCGYGDGGPLVDTFDNLYEPRECRQMVHVMANNTVDALLKAGVPANIRVAHKHGWIDTTHSNGGIFFTPGGDFVMVMFMYQPEWLDFQRSLPVIAESARIVYNYYNPDAPLDEIREGYIPPVEECNYTNSPLTIDLRQPVWDE